MQQWIIEPDRHDIRAQIIADVGSDSKTEMTFKENAAMRNGAAL